ncbi:3865_t:CDS:2 [Diversispora eburnea]|uniref:3865_t:CDS:1 n=1 Tax=Diversispora eburnea TaxID=1213867 RepID=A0A9N8Z0A1_9GLOM|nr:3865_t:CDS:2 [Diversispora eburnea]
MELKETSYSLRIFQFVVAFLILLLEFIAAIGFKANYYDKPTHGLHFLYWVTLITQNLYMRKDYLPQWKSGNHIYKVISDCITLFTWLSLCLLNISPALHNEKLDCGDKSGSSLTRCRLFLTNLSLGWILIPTFIGSLFISIYRWKNNESITSSIPMNKVNNSHIPKTSRPLSYSVQKGVLDGQPVLIFNDKRNSFYNSSTNTRTPSYPDNTYHSGSSPDLINDSFEHPARDYNSKS